ncbi:Unknown protein sequence [Pseudomonas syringae pv. philadelphi]|nr:Unknown protein sequence [Pseudomonas syringae pv. philadelphi]RMP64074.1 hypothetical protein ALQ19_05715 [Pseudomonas syringae pv. berberidis]RMQ37124.1 hypothetical protein ALQ06_05805 [Pseudomonas syringae pv. berberidis]
MAGNGHRQLVGTAGIGDGPNCAGHTQLSCDVGVSGGRSGRDVSERLPYPLLKYRATDVQRQCETGRGRLNKADDGRNQRFKLCVCADQVGVGKLVLKTLNQCIGVIPEGNRADPIAAGRHQNRPQRTFTQRESDIDVGAARPVFGRFHAEHVLRSLIETTVGVVARLVQRTGDGHAPGKLGLHPRAHGSSAISLGREPGNFLERAVKMKAAHPDRFCQLGQVRHRIAGVYRSARVRDCRRVLEIDALLILSAAHGGPKTGGFGLACTVKEHDIFRPWQPARAAGCAIDTGRAHRVDKISTHRRTRAAVEQNIPARVIFSTQCLLWRRGVDAVHVLPCLEFQ